MYYLVWPPENVTGKQIAKCGRSITISILIHRTIYWLSGYHIARLWRKSGKLRFYEIPLGLRPHINQQRL